MSSINIYGVSPSSNSIGPFHYLYRITNVVENKHYYGIRTSKNALPQDDLGTKYFSSSRDKEFITDQKLHPENYKYKIVRISENRKEVAELEIFMQTKFEVSKNPKFYNRAIQTSSGFSSLSLGKVVVRDETGKCIMIDENDPRYISGQLVGHTAGLIPVLDENGKGYKVLPDDPRYLSGQLISVSTGRVVVRDGFNNQFMVYKNDPRYISGELVSVHVGKTTVRDEDGNCFRISKDDPRYISKELICVLSVQNQIIVKDSSGHCFKISKDDPRYTSGELVANSKNTALVRDPLDPENKVFRVPCDDPDYVSGKLRFAFSGNWNGCFKHYKKTPWGVFESLYALEPEISYGKLFAWCGSRNERPVNKFSYNHCKKLQETFGPDCIGKTYKELGFGLLTPEEYQQLIG